MRSVTPSVLCSMGMASGAFAANCLLEQRRQDSLPTGEQIAKALTSNSALDHVCGENWRANDEYQLNNTFNHWNLLYSVQREDKELGLAWCKDAFNEIISECIVQDNFWGGSFSFEGETYAISNLAYPENGLGPDDEGGPVTGVGCPSCPTCADFDILSPEHIGLLPNGGDPELATIDFNLWTSLENTFANAKATPVADDSNLKSPPTQSATPTESPDPVESNNGVLDRRDNHWSSNEAIRARDPDQVVVVGGCTLPYILPDSPSSREASGIDAVQKWYDRDDTEENCDNPTLRQYPSPVEGHEYDTVNVYEKHIIKRFLHFLIGGEQAFDSPMGLTEIKLPPTSCRQAQFAMTKTNPQNPALNEPVAMQIAKAISCRGAGCPVADGSRDSEFFLLRKEINTFKNRILGGKFPARGHLPTSNDDRIPDCLDLSPAQMQQAMIDAALVFKFLNRKEVFDSFNAVHTRIRLIMANLDNDQLLGAGAGHQPMNLAAYLPPNRPKTWLSAYDEFISRFLKDAERKMSRWRFDCVDMYRAQLESDAERLGWSQEALNTELAKVDKYTTGNGTYSSLSFKFDPLIWGSASL